MGFFKDIADGYKQYKNDPAKYKTINHKCTACNETGICQICKGKANKLSNTVYQLFKYLTIILSIYTSYYGLYSLILIAFYEEKNYKTKLLIGLILFIIFSIITICISIFFRCHGCQDNAADILYIGKCRTCKGKGFTTENIQVAGKTIIQGVSNAFNASKKTKEVIKDLELGNASNLKGKLSQALLLNDNNFEANALSGILAYQTDNSREALKFLLKAEKIKPKNIHILKMLCCVYEEIGNTNSSEHYFNKLLSVEMKNLNRLNLVKEISAGFIGGVASVLVGIFINDLE